MSLLTVDSRGERVVRCYFTVAGRVWYPLGAGLGHVDSSHSSYLLLLLLLLLQC